MAKMAKSRRSKKAREQRGRGDGGGELNNGAGEQQAKAAKNGSKSNISVKRIDERQRRKAKRKWRNGGTRLLRERKNQP